MNLPENFFLYVGNAYPHKNLERLLEAFGGLEPKISNLKLLFVGGEDYFYKRLKNKVRETDLENKIIFYGPATREELTDLYQKALALVFPSLMEGFGLPAVEAMAQNSLVLCSDIPVFHEVLGEAALYFNPNNPEDIKDKMKKVLENPGEFADYKNKGKEQISKYSWEKLARETLQIYQSI